MCDKGLIWNPSNCKCECDKSCAVEEYFNYEKCRKRLIDKLVEECSENIDGNEMIHNDYKNVCNSCRVYIVLFAIAFLMIIGISSAFIYFHWNKSNTDINPGTETVIYETYKWKISSK